MPSGLQPLSGAQSYSPSDAAPFFTSRRDT
jgi:hypothetical protein